MKYFFGFWVSVCVLIIAFAIYEKVEHQRFLEQHGCQMYFDAYTGHDYISGKVVYHEHVRVYECADGRRTELQ